MRPVIITISVMLLLFNHHANAQSGSVWDAVDKSDSVQLGKLIRAGADVDEKRNGATPLMTACRWNDVTLVRILLAHGASASVTTPKGRNPLMVACAYYAGPEICKMLIQKGAALNTQQVDGATALMLAAMNGKIEVVELLLKKGADPNVKDSKGLTALDYAEKAEISQFLLDTLKDQRIDKDAVIAKLREVTKR